MSGFSFVHKNTFGFNLCGSTITFAVLLRVFKEAKLHWEMHPAQLFSIELQSTLLDGATELTTEVPEEEAKELLKRELKHTLMGIPVNLRQDYPETWIRLYAGDTLVGYIERCAVPCAFGSDWDFDAHQKSEDEKARKIRETDYKENTKWKRWSK